ncbi:hypothetical protein TNCV_4677351 [Trichonephila clavipes]|nr:hypothetical protein TNCV_4677351 [Trichonephila clavipes]
MLRPPVACGSCIIDTTVATPLKPGYVWLQLFSTMKVTVRFRSVPSQGLPPVTSFVSISSDVMKMEKIQINEMDEFAVEQANRYLVQQTKLQFLIHFKDDCQ